MVVFTSASIFYAHLAHSLSPSHSHTQTVCLFLFYLRRHIQLFSLRINRWQLRTKKRNTASVERIAKRMKQQSKFDSRFVYRMHNKILVSDFPREKCMHNEGERTYGQMRRATEIAMDMPYVLWLYQRTIWDQKQQKCSQSSSNEYPFVWTFMVQTHH